MHPMLNIALQAARQASKIILHSLDRLKDIKIESKGIKDFVTDVDRKSERIIIDVLHHTYPDHSILSEEIGKLEGHPDHEWIIDPLDGTTNFIQGIPCFAISIAYRYKGRLQHGLIYDPIHQEVFTASNGYGAKLNDHRIRVSSKQKLEEAVIGTGFPFKSPKLAEPYLKTFSALFNKSQDLRRMGSAAIDLAYLACGRLDGFWEFNLSVWDIAAGVLIIREAGGLISDFEGGENYFQSGNIVASNPKLMKPLLSRIHNAVNQ